MNTKSAKIVKQDATLAAVVAGMVASAVSDTPAAAVVEQKTETSPVETSEQAAVKVVKKALKIVKAKAKPAKVAKKAAKAVAKKTAKAAVAKAQKSAKESTAIRSDKQGLTFGQWLKLLSNTAAKTGVKVPSTVAGLTKKFEPVYMAGTSVKAALAS